MEPNPFRRSMNELQKRWYSILLARRIGFEASKRAKIKEDLSYSAVCRKRYATAFRRYNKRFREEIKRYEEMQPCAIDAMRVHRTFAITTLWPPMYSKHEINSTLEKLELVLTAKERRRLEQILKQDETARFWKV